jgi:hypothetical protein
MSRGVALVDPEPFTDAVSHARRRRCASPDPLSQRIPQQTADVVLLEFVR